MSSTEAQELMVNITRLLQQITSAQPGVTPSPAPRGTEGEGTDGDEEADTYVTLDLFEQLGNGFHDQFEVCLVMVEGLLCMK